MIAEYLQAAMNRAHYELITDDEPFYGEIPELQGVWSTGKSLEECRANLLDALEGWLLLSVRRVLAVPEIGGLRFEVGETEPVHG